MVDGCGSSQRVVGRTDALQNLQTFCHSPKDNMLAITLRCRRKGDEELAAVCVLAGVGHADHTLLMLQLQTWLLIIELAAVDAVAARAVSCADNQFDLW